MYRLLARSGDKVNLFFYKVQRRLHVREIQRPQRNPLETTLFIIIFFVQLNIALGTTETPNSLQNAPEAFTYVALWSMVIGSGFGMLAAIFPEKDLAILFLWFGCGVLWIGSALYTYALYEASGQAASGAISFTLAVSFGSLVRAGSIWLWYMQESVKLDMRQAKAARKEV